MSAATDEARGCGCLVLMILPLVVLLSAYAAHCGWSAYHP